MNAINQVDENFYGEPCHDLLYQGMKQEFSFDANADFSAWKQELRERFLDVTGVSRIEQNAAPARNVEIEYEQKMEGYTKIRFTFESEIGTRVPCWLLVPDTGKEKYPVAITLQGHSTGAHNSVGEIKFEKDADYQTRGKFGIQAVENGYAALCIEQRGMGERKPTVKSRKAPGCTYTALTALQLGRTVIGERMFDVRCAIDVLADFDKCDTDKILITGNSGGGTASFYCACYDERIKLSVPSCSFCPYRESILELYHCACNYIPSAYRYFDMQDLSALIAPRPLAIVTGQLDTIFPIDAVRRGYETVKEIYRAAGAADACNLVETPREHWWCVDIVWPTINAAAEKLGWK